MLLQHGETFLTAVPNARRYGDSKWAVRVQFRRLALLSVEPERPQKDLGSIPFFMQIRQRYASLRGITVRTNT